MPVHRFLRRLFLPAACGLLALTCAAGVFVPRSPADQGLAQFSPWRWREPSTWDEAVRQRFGMRNTLAGVGSLWGLRVLGRVDNPRIVIGREGWMFYLNPTEAAGPFPPALLDAWTRYAEDRAAWFERRGMRYVLILIPDKQNVYGEFLPDGPSPGAGRYAEMVEALRRRGRVRFIDVLPAVLSVKEKGQAFFRYDTHWTPAAAYAAYRYAAERLTDLIGPPLPPDAVNTLPWTMRGQDLPRLLSLNWLPLEERYDLPQLSHPSSASVFCAQDVHGGGDRRVVQRTPRAGAPDALIYRDSFFASLTPFFAEHFRTMTTLPFDTASPMRREDILFADPDVVLEVRMTRRLRSDAFVPAVEPWMAEDNAAGR